MTETEAISLAAQPDKIIDGLQCNTVIGFLNGYISDLALAEWELEVQANNHHVLILHQDSKTVALKEAEWKTSKPYTDWRELKLKLSKFRAYRADLRRKEEMLQFKPRSNNFPSGGY